MNLRPMTRNYKILVCDDEKAVRDSLEFILRGKYAISFVCDGPEALEYIKKYHTDLMLLDLKMPQMDGMRVLKQVQKTNPEVKIIVVTGYSSIDTAYRAIKTGASNYISKPFDKEHILKAIKQVLAE